MKTIFAPKTIELPNGNHLHFWYANNAGVGANCRIIESTEHERASVSKKQSGVVADNRIVAWNGVVRISDLNKLGYKL